LKLPHLNVATLATPAQSEAIFMWNNTDNYFNESLPLVFERTLAPVFAALQVSFVVRNHALGNNPCYPYDACIATHVGQDLDILAWEQVC
jgi:hypothetical protein